MEIERIGKDTIRVLFQRVEIYSAIDEMVEILLCMEI
uniref:Uncharacterized protein n=1 Tax=Parascaris equorum TaxID=6256 RepID=A0A914SI05_PAREQ